MLVNRKVPNEPGAISELIEELRRVDAGAVTAGLDVIGGIAGLVTSMLAAAGIRCLHVPGRAVNRARQATCGGEN